MTKSSNSKNDELNVEQIISELVGEDVLDVVKKIKNKQNISELDIVNKDSKDINQARNALYKLYENNLVSFTRKKDKDKGLYIYYWTFNEDKIKNIIDASNKEKLDNLRNRLVRERNNQFFKCKNNCIRLDFDQSLDFEFRCPECGELLEFDDNSDKIKDIEKKINELENYFKNRNDEKEKNAKEVLKKLKQEEILEKETEEKERVKKEEDEKISKLLNSKIKITKDIFLIEQFDKKLFDLFIKYYKPLVSSKHKDDKYKYIIYEKEKAIGVVTFKQESSNIMQIMLLNSKQKKGIAKKIITKVSNELKIAKFEFSCIKQNYPQLKMLYSLKGGLNTKNPKNILQEGIVKFGKTQVPKKSIDLLKEILLESKKAYKNIAKDLKNRKEEKEELEAYIKKIQFKY